MRKNLTFSQMNSLVSCSVHCSTIQHTELTASSNSFPDQADVQDSEKGIDQNFEKYEEISNKRREAGRKGGIISQQKQNQANESNDKQNQANESKDKQNHTNQANTKTIINTNTKTNTNNSSSAKLSERVLEDEFQEVWNIYPRKEGRKKALKPISRPEKTALPRKQFSRG